MGYMIVDHNGVPINIDWNKPKVIPKPYIFPRKVYAEQYMTHTGVSGTIIEVSVDPHIDI